MSVVNLRAGGIEPPETTLLTTTNATPIVTGVNYLRTVEVITLANLDGSNACIVKLDWVDETPASHTFFNEEVPAKKTIVIDNIPINLSDKYKVRSINATAANADDISVTVITSAQTQQEKAR